MRIFIFCTFLLFFFSFRLNAQPKPPFENFPKPEAMNAILLEVGGSFFWPGGLHLERFLIRKKSLLWTVRAGVGVDLWHQTRPLVAFPVGSSICFGKHSYFELGSSVTFLTWTEKIQTGTDSPPRIVWHSDQVFTPSIGYRFIHPDTGLILRFQVLPVSFEKCRRIGMNRVCDQQSWIPWFGIGGGLAF